MKDYQMPTEYEEVPNQTLPSNPLPLPPAPCSALDEIKRLRRALEDICDILPWGPCEAETMIRIARNALQNEQPPNSCYWPGLPRQG